jgi:hypothetical protein
MFMSSFIIWKTHNKYAISGGRLREEDDVLASPEWGKVEAKSNKANKEDSMLWIILDHQLHIRRPMMV